MQEPKSEARLFLENAPEYVVKLLAADTLKAIRRYMEIPGNGEKLEELGREYLAGRTTK